MNFNNFTIKSQEAVHEAVNLVQSRGQQYRQQQHAERGPPPTSRGHFFLQSLNRPDGTY